MRSLRSAVPVALFFALLITASAQSGSTVETADRVNKTFTLQRGAEVSVDNDLGGVEIMGQAGTQAVVDVEKRYGSADEDTRNRIREAKVHIDGSASSLRIRVEWPKCFMDCGNWRWNGEKPGIFIKLRVPREVNVSVKHDRGAATVNNVQGDISIETDRSPVKVKDVTGSLKIDVDRGEVRVDNLSLTGRLDIESDRGAIGVTISKLAGDINISADRGNVELAVPDGSGMNIHIDGTRRSSFRTEFPMQVTGRLNGADTSGTVNGGGRKVTVHIDRGRIELTKARATL